MLPGSGCVSAASPCICACLVVSLTCTWALFKCNSPVVVRTETERKFIRIYQEDRTHRKGEGNVGEVDEERKEREEGCGQNWTHKPSVLCTICIAICRASPSCPVSFAPTICSASSIICLSESVCSMYMRKSECEEMLHVRPYHLCRWKILDQLVHLLEISLKFQAWRKIEQLLPQFQAQRTAAGERPRVHRLSIHEHVWYVWHVRQSGMSR